MDDASDPSFLTPAFLTRRAFVAAAGLAAATTTTSTWAAEKVADPALAGKSNFGQGADDEALRAAWKTFCKQLEEAGDYVFKAYNPAIPLQRADGFRFLTQNLGQAFDLAYEKKDPLYPEIQTFCTPHLKLGGDNADCVYQSAWIDGNSVYKLSGNKGTVRFLNFTTMGPRPSAKPGSDWHPLHEPFGDIPQANLFGHKLETDWEGNFELYIGGPKRGRTGCRPMRIPASFSSASTSTTGARFRRSCALSASA